MIKLMYLLISVLVSININAQLISNNTYMYGFTNVFQWHCIDITGIEMYPNSTTSLVFYENIENVVDNFITCSVVEYSDGGYSDWVNSLLSDSEVSVLSKAQNKVMKNDIYIFRNNVKNQLNAFIDHGSMILVVRYKKSNGIPDLEKFIEFVGSYNTVRVNLDFL